MIRAGGERLESGSVHSQITSQYIIPSFSVTIHPFPQSSPVRGQWGCSTKIVPCFKNRLPGGDLTLQYFLSLIKTRIPVDSWWLGWRQLGNKVCSDWNINITEYELEDGKVRRYQLPVYLTMGFRCFCSMPQLACNPLEISRLSTKLDHRQHGAGTTMGTQAVKNRQRMPTENTNDGFK